MQTVVEAQETSKKSSISLFYLLILVLIVLVGLGLSGLFSASYDKAMRLGFEPDYFFTKQLVFAIGGIAAACVVFFIPKNFYRLITPLLILVSLSLMLLTLFTNLGESRLGARRWIQFGSIGFQPSELVKISAILFLANYFDKHSAKLKYFTANVYPAIVVLIFAGLILMQRDFSTTLIYTAICFSLFIAAGTRFSYLLYMISFVGVPGLLILLTETYRLERVIGYIFKDIDPSGMNYQVNASLAAIKAGGLTGKGFGNGIYKLGRLPEVQSDFIFASFIEENGFAGGSFVIILFGLLAYTGYRGSIKLRESDPYLFFLGFGITSVIVWQALLNIGVVTGIIPPTGIPLPFFSQGGTSLLVNLGMSGLLCKVLYNAETQKLERGRAVVSQNTSYQEVTYE
ncbi:MAG: cell division protein FtsW [Spirochaetales bacterium]|nr:cell division protein FtsW [Spirochaetales bacterium]